MKGRPAWSTCLAMKTVTINGIPYSMNDKNELFMYGTLVRVGSAEMESYKEEYRRQLKEKTVSAMEYAKKQFEGTA